MCLYVLFYMPAWIAVLLERAERGRRRRGEEVPHTMAWRINATGIELWMVR
jgi:hypothetical protein